jgi:hypothetical protein
MVRALITPRHRPPHPLGRLSGRIGRGDRAGKGGRGGGCLGAEWERARGELSYSIVDDSMRARIGMADQQMAIVSSSKRFIRSPSCQKVIGELPSGCRVQDTLTADA